MTVNLTVTVQYKWVERDKLNAPKIAPSPAPSSPKDKWADYQNRQLTPYGFVREMLPGCEKYKAGDMVSISLSKSFLFPFEVRRFGNLPADVDWLDIPKEVSTANTIGELCSRLYKLGDTTMKEKLGGIYDAFKDYDPAVSPEGSVKLARQALARIIFDHWGNTELRHSIIQQGDFDWSHAWEVPRALSAVGASEGKDFAIVKVPMHEVVVKTVPAAKGTQEIKIPPADAARTVLEYIKTKAKERAKTPPRVDEGSKFYKRLVSFYLVDYLASPSPTAGVSAIAKIGEVFKGDPQDWWEETALTTFNQQAIPDALRKIRPNLPVKQEAATEILNHEKRSLLP